ncbi:MAG: winged helix-turn-helix domain-containing protein [Candidatus Omnitrophota bacterium]
MIMEIGIVAGEIWHFLDDKKNATADELTKSLKRPHELVLMSLGWLAREGHITLGAPESGYSATLNRK